MENRIAVISIIVEAASATAPINALLTQHAEYIIGRMGIPYKHKGISVISVALDAPASVVSALSGRLGMLEGVSAKTVTSKKAY